MHIPLIATYSLKILQKRHLKSANSLSIHPHSLIENDRADDNFLIHYREYTTTGIIMSQIFKSRNLRTNFECIVSACVCYLRGNDLRLTNGIVNSNNGRPIKSQIPCCSGTVRLGISV